MHCTDALPAFIISSEQVITKEDPASYITSGREQLFKGSSASFLFLQFIVAILLAEGGKYILSLIMTDEENQNSLTG